MRQLALVGLALLLAANVKDCFGQRQTGSSRAGGSGGGSNFGSQFGSSSNRSLSSRGSPFSQRNNGGVQFGAGGMNEMGVNSLGGSPLQGDTSQLSPLSRSGDSANSAFSQQSRNFASPGGTRRSRNSNGSGNSFQGMQQSALGNLGQYRPRAVVQTSFPVPPPNPSTIVRAATAALSPQNLPNGRDIRVSFDNGIVTVSGSVATAHDAQLAAALLSLEPGVRRVENRLSVEPSD